MKRGRGTDGETVTGGRAATVRHVFGERVLSICMPTNKDHPKGWRWVALSDVAQMESGHTPSRNHPEYWGGDIPWISVKDARLAHGKRLSETEEYTNSLGIANSSARLLPAGTVCLSRGGTVGYVVILDRPMATSQGFANWICGPQLIPEFLQYLLLAEADALEKFSIGTTIKTIYYPDLKAFHVCLPPPAEQKRIVALLDEAFAGIDEAKAKAEANIEDATHLFRSHTQSIFSQRIDGWPTKQLSDICDFEGGSQPPKSKFIYSQKPGYVRFLQIRDFRSDKYVTFIPESKKNRHCEESDILIARYGASVGKILTGKSGAYNVALMKTLPDLTQLDLNFFHQYLTSGAFQDQLVKVAARSAQNGFSKEDIHAFPVPVPPLAEQRRVIQQLNPLSELCQKLSTTYGRKQTMLSDLKQSLLAQAFAGELTA